MIPSDHIIIIGGGAAGLMAASLLSAHATVTVLEAEEVCGGRIKTKEVPGFSRYLEAGAEFIHGNLPVTLQLLQDAELQYEPVGGKMYRVSGNRLLQENEMFEGWDALLEKMDSLQEDMTLDDFFRHYYADEKYNELKQQVRSFAQGFDLADPALASVKSLYEEWSAEEQQNYRLTGGYRRLVDHLSTICRQNGCNILTGMPVAKVEWQTGKVKVFAGNTVYEGNGLLVTIPASLLQQPHKSIEFVPALTDHYKAAGCIGMGSVIKIVLEFKEKCWEADTGFLLSNEMVPTWWTQLPEDNNILTGWIGGPGTRTFSAYTDDEIRLVALRSLAAILDRPVDFLDNNLKAIAIYNWQKNKYACGAYTFETLTSGEARKLLQVPIDDTIWFAGEALYEGAHPGTVEAALVSGKNAAENILSAFNSHDR